MKRYLLVSIAVLFVNVNASLVEDFTQMDEEQEQLFSDMRKSTSLNATEDQENLVEENETIILGKTDNRHKKDVSNENNTEESQSEANKKLEDNSKKTIQDEIKIEVDAIEAEFIKVKNLRKKTAAKQREIEKREVEAYEKQRAEKLAQEAAQKAALEKKKLAQKSFEEAAKKKKAAEVASLKEIQKVKTAAIKVQAAPTVDDVNISRELEEKTEAADIEYDKAVEEMKEES